MEQLEKQFSGMCLIKIIINRTNIKNPQNKNKSNTILAKQHLKQIKMLGHMKLMNLYTVLNQDDEKYFFSFQVKAMTAALSVSLSSVLTPFLKKK